MGGNNNIPSDNVNVRKPITNLPEVKKTTENNRKQLANWKEMQIEALKRMQEKDQLMLQEMEDNIKAQKEEMEKELQKIEKKDQIKNPPFNGLG